MATIKVTSNCNAQSIEIMPNGRIHGEVIKIRGLDGKTTVDALYRYLCPECGEQEFKHTSVDTVDLLEKAGVTVERIEIDVKGALEQGIS